MLHELFLLATSYAPNHNFWRGDPIDWWIRGVLKCIELNAVPLAGGAFMFWVSKRTRSWIHWVIGWAAICFVWSILLPGMAYRDSDTPTAIGWRWGNRLRPWVTIACLAVSAAPLLKKGRPQPAFPVVARASCDEHVGAGGGPQRVGVDDAIAAMASNGKRND